MEPEEINGILWDTLADSKQPVLATALARYLGQPIVQVQTGLARLRQAGLVEVVQPYPHLSVQVVRDLDALRWAQAVSLGVELLSLERHARLSSSARAEALRLATDGSLDRIEQKRRSEKRKARDAAVRGRAASKAAATDLAQILKDTQGALAAAAAPKDSRERAIAALLKQASEEAEKALSGLVKSMATK